MNNARKETVMIYVAKIIALIATIAAITACGGSDSGGSAEQMNLSESPALTAVSNEGEVVVGAVFFGGLRSGNVAPFSSASAKTTYKESHGPVLNLLVQTVIRRIADVSASKSVSMTRNGNKAQIVFKNETIAFSGGNVTFDGVFDYEMKTANQISMIGSVAVKHVNVGVLVTQKEKTYSESVNGTLQISVSADISYQLGSDGQISEMKIDGTIELLGRDLLVSGDIGGNLKSIKIYSKVAAEIVGKKIKNSASDCGGYASIEINGKGEVCGILSTCDGCELP